MRTRFVLTFVLAPVLVVAAALAGGWLASGTIADTRSSLTTALDTLPDDAVVAGFTDWAAIRSRLGVAPATSAAARASLAESSATRDLSSRSVIGVSIEEMHRSFGWSAADIDWEVYGQANDGSAMVARLGRDLPLSTVRAGLRRLGYTQSGDIWNAAESGGSADPDLNSTFASVAIVPRQHLVVAADRESYARTVLGVIDRDQPSLLTVRPAADVARALIGSDTALLQGGAFTCNANTLARKDAEVQAQGRSAVERAGELVAPTYTGRGLVDESRSIQSARFVLAFGSSAEASSQLAVRTRLTSGPFIGRSGRVEDSLVLDGATVAGSTIDLRFEHDPDSAVVMADTGPVLFAGCPA